jgi:hypothetical protein
MMIHVDDILYFGTTEFLNKVMTPFKRTFKISREDMNAFKYVGINIDQGPGSISMDQRDYLESMKAELLPKETTKDTLRFVSDDEKKIFKQGIGQLGWLAGVSKPEAAFTFCMLSTVQSKPQVADFIKYKKIVRDLKNYDSWLTISKLNLDEAQIAVFSDASFANLSGGASQLGYIVFLHDNAGNCVPLTWASKKAKRVARSTLTAETLAAVEAVDVAFVSQRVLAEVLVRGAPPIMLYVDNKSLYDAAKTTNTLADKRLMIDISALRQMLERK